MKRTILILVLLTTTAAMGQSLKTQKACYVQAQKVSRKDPATHMSNHFDARTHKCWVKEYREANGSIDESVYNAFEPNVWEAEFAGNATPKDTSIICWVRDTKCSNIAEFEQLAKQRYGF